MSSVIEVPGRTQPLATGRAGRKRIPTLTLMVAMSNGHRPPDRLSWLDQIIADSQHMRADRRDTLREIARTLALSTNPDTLETAPGLNTLATKSGTTTRTTLRHLRWMRENGYLIWVAQGSTIAGNWRSRYMLTTPTPIENHSQMSPQQPLGCEEQTPRARETTKDTTETATDGLNPHEAILQHLHLPKSALPALKHLYTRRPDILEWTWKDVAKALEGPPHPDPIHAPIADAVSWWRSMLWRIQFWQISPTEMRERETRMNGEHSRMTRAEWERHNTELEKPGAVDRLESAREAALRAAREATRAGVETQPPPWQRVSD